MTKPILSAEDVETFYKNGFLHVKNVFAVDELKHMRVPDPVRSVWDDGRMVDMARSILGGKPVYYFFSLFGARPRPAVRSTRNRHAHHDATGTREHLHNRYHGTEDFPVIRFGIYFQDYSKNDHSGGLKLSPGSHKIDSSSFDEYTLTYVNLPTVPGDVVIFSKRLLHSGNALLQRSAPEIVLSPCAENTVLQFDSELFLPDPSLRETLFLDYCDHSEVADIHIKSMALNSPPAVPIASKIDAALFDRARNAGLDLRIDAALMECCDNVVKEMKPNGKIGGSALPAIADFLRLLPLAAEYSSYYPFWTELPPGPPGCLEAIKRIGAYRATAATMTQCTNMMASIDRNMLAQLERSVAHVGDRTKLVVSNS